MKNTTSILIVICLSQVLEGKAHMQLNLTFFPLPNFTEVILDQDIECRPQPPENDQNTNKNPNLIKAAVGAAAATAGWVNCESSHRENNVISELPLPWPPAVGSRIRCRKNLPDGGNIVSHCLSIKASKCSLNVVSVRNHPNILTCDIQPKLCEGITTITGWKWSGNDTNSFHILPSNNLQIETNITTSKIPTIIHCQGKFASKHGEETYPLQSNAFRLQDQLGRRRRERLPRLRRLPRNAKRIHQKSSKVVAAAMPTSVTKTREITTTVEWKVEENDTVTIPCYGIDVRKHEVLWDSPSQKSQLFGGKANYGIGGSEESIRDTMRINDDGSLRIPNVNREKHQGIWRCRRRRRAEAAAANSSSSDVGNRNNQVLVRLSVSSSKPFRQAKRNHVPTSFRNGVSIQPSNVTAYQDEIVTFVCNVDHEGEIIIEWFKNGHKLKNKDRVLRLEPTVAPSTHSGWYQCIVTQGIHVIGNGISKLEVKSSFRPPRSRREAAAAVGLVSTARPRPPRLRRQPYFISVSPDQRISPGGSVKLKCIASGNPLPRLAWLLNGEVLPESIVQEARRVNDGGLLQNSSRIDFHLDSASPQASGLYSCRADNVFGEAEALVRISVDGLPFIREMTTPRKLLAGSQLEWLYCPYGGFPIDKITWDKDGEELPINERQYLFENGTLLLKSVRQSDGGEYTCTVVQGSNSVSQSVTVQVQVPPRIERFDFPLNLQEGWRARVTCAARIGDLPIRFQWHFNGQKLNGNDVSLIISPDAFSSSLSFTSLRTSHSGNYTCEASNAASSDKYSSHLLVNVPPKWKAIPEDTHVRAGSTLLIKCQASGVPHPRILWKKAEKNPENPVKNRFADILPDTDPHFKLLGDGDLMIVNGNESHEGKYLCQANNGVGSGKSKLISINVDVPPTFDMEQTGSTQTANVNQEGPTIKCVVIGDRPLHISWRRNGIDIATSSSRRQFSVEEEMVPKGLQSTIRLKGTAQRQDSARFQCLARNDFGSNKTDINFVVQEVPETPKNFVMVSHSSRQANLSWGLPYDGQSPLLAFHLEFQRPVGHELNDLDVGQPQPPTAASAVASASKIRVEKAIGNATWLQVSDLQPNTLFSVRLMALNAVGTSQSTPKLRFKTDQEHPEGLVTQIEVESNSSQSVVVTWKPPHPDLQHGAITSYSIGYRLANSSEPFRYVTIDARNPRTRLNWTIEQLKTFSNYAIIVQAFNRRGAGPKSPEIIVTTMEDVPSSPPDNVQCFAVSSRALYITWTPPRLEDRNGLLVEYGVFYRPLILWQEKAHMLEARTLDEKMTLEGLNCYQNYSIQVVASTKVGDGLKSRSIYCRTKEDFPGPPKNIKALPVDKNSIMISWLPPGEPNGEILGYSLYMKTMEKGRQFTQDFSLGPHINYYTMSGLHQAQPYSFWVSAFTLAGEGQVSEIVAETPQVSMPAGIASFSQTVTHALKESVEMKCAAVAIPSPKVYWTKNGNAIYPGRESAAGAASSRLLFEDNGFKLRLDQLEMSDAANYSCQAENFYGRDAITYHLQVKLSRNNGVPPAPPSELVVSSVTRSSVTLSWSESQVDGGSPVTSLRLHYHRQFGDWDRVDVAANLSSHSLRNLRCGTIYQFFMEAINEFGVGERTDTLTLSTQGTPPKAPVVSMLRPPHGLLSVNATSIDLNLAAWGSGGCDISSFVIEYRQQRHSLGDTEWILVNNNVRPLDLAQGNAMHYVVLDLKPRTPYVLRITAHNSAGSTVKEYKFSTLGDNGSNIVDSEELLISSNQTSSMTLPAILLFLLPVGVLLLGIGVTLCLHRKRIKQGLIQVGLHFSKTHEQGGLRHHQAPMVDITGRSPPPTRIRGQVFNEYEMSASDLNYGFVGGGGHVGGHVGHGGSGGRVVGGLHGMDTFAASSSCNDIMIGNSSSTPASSLSPAIFSSRKLLNDASSYHYIVEQPLPSSMQHNGCKATENPYSTIHWQSHHHHKVHRGGPRTTITHSRIHDNDL